MGDSRVGRGSLPLGADSESGQLRSVIVHRPGPELARMSPRHSGRLLFATVPWPDRAREEHDALTAALRQQGVQVFYLAALLADALEYAPARAAAIASAVDEPGLGQDLRAALAARLESLAPEDLARVLITGLTPAELPDAGGLVYQLLGRHDFVLDPLPNLAFTRDLSFWVGDRVGVASPAPPHHRREAALLGIVYDHHPQFAGHKRLYGPADEPLDGGDVLALAPGVLAIGAGGRTSPAGADLLARRVLDAGLARAVLVIPLGPDAGTLDTVCTVVEVGTVIMHPAAAFSLTAHTVTSAQGGLRVSRPRPFLEAAAEAIGVDRLRLVDTGIDPCAGRSQRGTEPAGQWDDGHNALMIGPGLALVHERHAETAARLEAAGVRVIGVPGRELDSRRGGPRGLCCAVGREPAVVPETAAGPVWPEGAVPPSALSRPGLGPDALPPVSAPLAEALRPEALQPEEMQPEEMQPRPVLARL